MNEMNNGENNFNQVEQNQPVEQPIYQGPVQEPIYQAPAAPVEPTPAAPKKSYCGLLIVFMIISLLLTGYIVYDKVIEKEEVKEPKQEEKTGDVDTTPAKEEVKVVNAYASSDGLVVLPKLTGSSENITKFNKSIYDYIIVDTETDRASIIEDYTDEESRTSYQKFVDEIKKTDYVVKDYDSLYKFVKYVTSDGRNFSDFSIGYEKYQYNDIIAIHLLPFNYCNATCLGNKPTDWYFYDVKNDKKIDYIEAAKVFNATLDGKKITNFNELPSSCFEFDIDSNNNMNFNTEEVAC